MKYATIKLDLYKKGILASCDDIEDEEFIVKGDGNALMDFINRVEDLTDPDATYVLTDKGKQFLKDNINNDNLLNKEYNELDNEK